MPPNIRAVALDLSRRPATIRSKARAADDGPVKAGNRKQQVIGSALLKTLMSTIIHYRRRARLKTDIVA
jgi:hypothetical protein